MPQNFQYPFVTKVSQPSVEPLTLAEIKLFLRIDGNSEDTLLTSLLAAARISAEKYMRVSIINQQWKAVIQKSASGRFYLPYGPVNSIDSVTSSNKAGQSATVDSSFYHLEEGNRFIIFEPSVIAEKVEITYSSGYGADSTTIPESIKQGLLSQIAFMYENRHSDKMSEYSPLAEKFFDPHRSIYL